MRSGLGRVNHPAITAVSSAQPAAPARPSTSPVQIFGATRLGARYPSARVSETKQTADMYLSGVHRSHLLGARGS
jgi:hypothetical protein